MGLVERVAPRDEIGVTLAHARIREGTPARRSDAQAEGRRLHEGEDLGHRDVGEREAAEKRLRLALGGTRESRAKLVEHGRELALEARAVFGGGAVLAERAADSHGADARARAAEPLAKRLGHHFAERLVVL